MVMSEQGISVSVSVIAAAATDGRVYQVFGHLVAVGVGTLLVVPIGRTHGDLGAVSGFLGAPWFETAALIDAPLDAPADVAPQDLAELYPVLLAISPSGWQRDQVALVAGRKNVVRFSHPSGIRFGAVLEARHGD